MSGQGCRGFTPISLFRPGSSFDNFPAVRSASWWFDSTAYHSLAPLEKGEYKIFKKKAAGFTRTAHSIWQVHYMTDLKKNQVPVEAGQKKEVHPTFAPILAMVAPQKKVESEVKP